MTALLLDTHVAIWFAVDDARLGAATRRRMQEAAVVYFSAASVWEIEIKRALGKITVPDGFGHRMLDLGLVELPVSIAHASAIGSIDLDHRDPFDRLLAAQAEVAGCELVTADGKLLSALESTRVWDATR